MIYQLYFDPGSGKDFWKEGGIPEREGVIENETEIRFLISLKLTNNKEVVPVLEQPLV